MKEQQIKVLVIPSDRSGVSKFRSVDPHLKLQELYPNDFFVDIVTAGTDGINWGDNNYLKQFNILHFHRTISAVVNGQLQPLYGENAKKVFDKLRGMGIIIIMDIDDYWMPTIDHPAYPLLKTSKIDDLIKENFKMVDYVTTTTKIFGKEIEKYNKNVIVLPNAIDPDEPQFKIKPVKSDIKTRIGWLGGSSHLNDLNLMKQGLSSWIDSPEGKDSQLVVCGFDLRGSLTETNQQTGEQTTRKILPKESVWCRYEEMFTNNYKNLSPEYKKHLLKYSQDDDNSYNNVNEPYRRVWTKPITTYASNYNNFEISLAPLKDHIFNKSKSQLKVIEAGFHKKALIAQDFGPYTIDLVNVIEYGGGINENGNAILVNSNKNHKDWLKGIKFLHKHPEMVEHMGNNLYNTVNEKYNINVVTNSRAEFYKSVAGGKQKEVKQLIQETNAI
jgi:glycosyltransferase involved in cell wall biosynthesis